MKIKTTDPEIAALRNAVEQKFGTKILSPRHFVALSENIGDTAREYLSETTLQRIWLYKKGYDTVSVHTLNVLCHYAGFLDWDSFCNQFRAESPVESYMFEKRSLDLDRLKVGTIIHIAWLPDRDCTLRYLGHHRFEAIETHQSKLANGDIFTCHLLQLGREAYIELLRDDTEMSYIIGKVNGLTDLSVISE